LYTPPPLSDAVFSEKRTFVREGLLAELYMAAPIRAVLPEKDPPEKDVDVPFVL